MPEIPILRLKKNHERRLRGGHLWIYSNEVDSEQTSLQQFEPGQTAFFQTHDGKPLGCGYVNPHSLICGRLLGRRAGEQPDRALLARRLKSALELRERLFSEPFYRLIHAEGDGLPGLIVDRFGDVLAVQLTTAGMERLRETVISALAELLNPTAIVLRNDSPMRELEGLGNYVETVHGELPEQVLLRENGSRFQALVLRGQKTGWYFDHRMNRQRLGVYAPGQRVLDVFSYAGAWGVQAAVAGASEVWCLDSSQRAQQEIQANAELNQVGDRLRSLSGDAFEVLRDLHAERERFGLIILDPPAFIKRRKDQHAGEQAYHRLNRMAMRLLRPDGILISASCSMHLARETFKDILRAAGRHLDREIQLLEQGQQSPDHPVHPAIPETEYLKCLIARVTRG